MADRPILFSAPMVRALLEGRKTQTRRVLKPQPFIDAMGNVAVTKNGKTTLYGQHPDGRPQWANYLACCYNIAPGDRLWVKETWSARMTHGWTIADARSRMFQEEIIYRADDESIDGWWPSLFMPREFSRLTLLVTDVRVQRLQEISGRDAVAEGVRSRLPENGIAQSEFQDLWNSIYDKKRRGQNATAWDENPWVAAISFTVHRANIDQVQP
jgi:hypothetical protein